MENIEPIIRMYLKVQPEKDPILYGLLDSLNDKEARVRRLLNLATSGIVLEKLSLSTSGLNNHQLSASHQLSEDHLPTPKNASSSSTVLNDVPFEEGEADDLKDSFGIDEP